MFNQGAALNFADDIDAVGAAAETGVNNLVRRVTGQPSVGYGMKDAYGAVLDASAAADQQFAKAHPVQATGLQIAGAVLSPAGRVGGGYIADGANAGARIARGVGVGAMTGAVAGAGAAHGGLKQRAIGAGEGTVVGAATGGLMTAGVEGATTAARAVNNATGGRFFSPDASALGRLRDALRADGVDEDAINTAVAGYDQAGASSPTLADVAGENTRALLRNAATRPGAARNLMTGYREETVHGLPGVAIERSRALTPNETRPASAVAAALDAERSTQASTTYRQPYSTQVPIGDDLASALGDAPGESALRQARNAALWRRDTEQVAEIDRLLAKAQPQPGVVQLPPVETPRGPDMSEDPGGGSLLTFIRQNGGLKDDGGELQARDLGRLRGRFQQHHVINPNGMSLGDAADRAWEAGHFPDAKLPAGGNLPDNYHPVSEGMLLDAIDKELRDAGKPSAEWLREEDAAAEHRWMDDSPDMPPPHDAAYYASLTADRPTVSAGTLHRVEIAMREKGVKMSRAGNGASAAGAADRQASIRSTLDQVPGLGPANAAFKSSSQAIDAVNDIGPTVLKAPPDEFAAQVGAMDPRGLEAARVGARQALTDTLGQRANAMGTLDQIAWAPNARRNLTALFGADEAGRFIDAARLNLQRARNANYMAPNTGSQTFGRGQDANFFGSVLHAVHRPVQALLERIASGLTITDAEAEALVRAGLIDGHQAAAAVRPRITMTGQIGAGVSRLGQGATVPAVNAVGAMTGQPAQ